MKQALTQKSILKQQTSQQTIQLMRMLESNTDTLETEILKEVENNPVLEIIENPLRENKVCFVFLTRCIAKDMKMTHTKKRQRIDLTRDTVMTTTIQIVSLTT